MSDESLLEHLLRMSCASGFDEVASILVAHRFPLALAERPLKSLSPGERVRAALICLLQRQPLVECLVLDEPTYSLDLAGETALRSVLRAWRGGLVVASHDEDFLNDIRIDRFLKLVGETGTPFRSSVSGT